MVAVITGQYASYKLMLITRMKSLKRYTIPSVAVIVLLAILFAVFTFYPPHHPLFQDPVTGKYGRFIDY